MSGQVVRKALVFYLEGQTYGFSIHQRYEDQLKYYMIQ
jgi:hypothetical protein